MKIETSLHDEATVARSLPLVAQDTGRMGAAVSV